MSINAKIKALREFFPSAEFGVSADVGKVVCHAQIRGEAALQSADAAGLALPQLLEGVDARGVVAGVNLCELNINRLSGIPISRMAAVGAVVVSNPIEKNMTFLSLFV